MWSAAPKAFLFNNYKVQRGDQGYKAKKAFKLGCTLPTYEPSPFGIIEAAHPLFSSWWQEWHAPIFNVPLHPLCQDLEPQFAPDSEVISLYSIISLCFEPFFHFSFCYS